MEHKFLPEEVRFHASYSQCIRRKYAAFVTNEKGVVLSKGRNERVGKCCEDSCVRDRLELGHGENTDAGAEIHAEQAALITSGAAWGPYYIYVAGMMPDGTPYDGFDNRPCYSCARMILYSGIITVFLPFDDEWREIAIYDIMENWEKSWERREDNA